jgi:hypothetical protein
MSLPDPNIRPIRLIFGVKSGSLSLQLVVHCFDRQEGTNALLNGGKPALNRKGETLR